MFPRGLVYFVILHWLKMKSGLHRCDVSSPCKITLRELLCCSAICSQAFGLS